MLVGSAVGRSVLAKEPLESCSDAFSMGSELIHHGIFRLHLLCDSLAPATC